MTSKILVGYSEPPSRRVGFLSGICIPCYNLLERLIPESRPLLEGVQQNLERWKGLADEQESLKGEREAAEAAAAEAKAKEASASSTLNGESEQNGSPKADTPTDSQTESPKKSLQKQVSLTVPANEAKTNSNSRPN